MWKQYNNIYIYIYIGHYVLEIAVKQILNLMRKKIFS